MLHRGSYALFKPQARTCYLTLQVEKKVFYLDLKRNSRGEICGMCSVVTPDVCSTISFKISNGAGTFLKLSEKGANRERSTIAVPGCGIVWFRELFGFYSRELAAGRYEPSDQLQRALSGPPA